jgi:hypothetical protein
MVLDGLPYRVVERASNLGAFEGWQPPTRLIAPFPSMTNVSLTHLLWPLGVEPVPGYELQHYDWTANAVHGGGALEHRDHLSPWREQVDVANRKLTGKFGTYARPRRHFRRDLQLTEEAVMDGDDELVLVHVGATDALQHLHGDASTLPLLFELAEHLRALQRRHLDERGSELRVILLSDHGNSQVKIRRLFHGRKLLKRAGLRVRKRLERAGDVVVGTFGVTGYAALYLHPEDAERAARAMLAHRGVDLAAWQTEADELRVLSDAGEAIICWRDGRQAYEAVSGDPLWLAAAAEQLRLRGRFDGEGFASGDDWLAATAEGRYPDAPRRLAEGLAGAQVRNRATVLLSLEPGWGWGWKSAAVFAWFRGGFLEGTHGGLDHDSSVGFLLASDSKLRPGPVARPGVVLARPAGVRPRAAQ